MSVLCGADIAKLPSVHGGKDRLSVLTVSFAVSLPARPARRIAGRRDRMPALPPVPTPRSHWELPLRFIPDAPGDLLRDGGIQLIISTPPKS